MGERQRRPTADPSVAVPRCRIAHSGRPDVDVGAAVYFVAPVPHGAPSAVRPRPLRVAPRPAPAAVLVASKVCPHRAGASLSSLKTRTDDGPDRSPVPGRARPPIPPLWHGARPVVPRGLAPTRRAPLRPTWRRPCGREPLCRTRPMTRERPSVYARGCTNVRSRWFLQGTAHPHASNDDRSIARVKRGPARPA